MGAAKEGGALTSDNKWKHLAGIGNTVGLFTLAGIIALGKVEEMTSFGLGLIVGGLVNLEIKYAEWCYSSMDKEEADEKKEKA